MTKDKGFICPYCKGRVTKEESVQEGRRYFHPDCHEKKLEEEKEQRKSSDDYKSLIKYICDLYKLKEPTGMILNQVKSFQTEYGFKLKGMELALRYFHETLNNPVREGDGIGIVIYVYEDAKKHFMTKLQVQQSLEECDGEIVTVKEIKVKSPQMKKQHTIKQIDISSL